MNTITKMVKIWEKAIFSSKIISGEDGIRTHDLLTASQAL